MEEHEKQGEHAHIRCRPIIEVLGKPKEHVESALKQYIDHIKDDSELVILKEDYSDIKDLKDGNLWSKFVELDLVVKGTKKLISFCFEYMPSSLEITKPESLIISNSELSGFVNDLQARLHNVDMIVKKLKGENDFLKLNMNAVLHNSIMICLKVGSFQIGQLSRLTGVEEKELDKFLDKMISENKIRKEGDSYSMAEQEKSEVQNPA